MARYIKINYQSGHTAWNDYGKKKNEHEQPRFSQMFNLKHFISIDFLIFRSKYVTKLICTNV